MQIIATIGVACAGIELIDLIEYCIQQNVTQFRFNFAKYDDPNDTINRAKEIHRLKNKYNIGVMVDLPYPYKKPRIFLNSSFDYKVIHKGDVFKISFSGENEIYTDTKDVSLLPVGSNLVYSDGDSIFRIVEKDNNGVVVQAQNKCRIVNSKSINFGHLIYNESLELCKQLVSITQPERVALSFVSSPIDVEAFKNAMDHDCEIISKIETELAMKSINAIAEVSDIMIARGDLCLYANYMQLPQNQAEIARVCRANNRNCYVATGILSTLGQNAIPSPAEMVDVANVIKLSPSGVILNFGVVQKGLKTAVEIIRAQTAFAKSN